MGVCIHWNARGFGILRSQASGEVFVHVKALANCEELGVGDVVTFEMGFDQRKQKPEALNCVKAGIPERGTESTLSGDNAAGSAVPPPPAPPAAIPNESFLTLPPVAPMAAPGESQGSL